MPLACWASCTSCGLILRLNGDFAVAEVDGGLAEDVVLAEFAEAFVVGGDGGFVGGDLLLLGGELGLLGLERGLLRCDLLPRSAGSAAVLAATFCSVGWRPACASMAALRSE